MFTKRTHRQPSDETRDLQIDGRTVPLRITANDRAKRLTLRVLPSGKGLRLTRPPGIAGRTIDAFIERQKPWIAERMAILPENPVLRDGVKVPLAGVAHRIEHRPGRGVTRCEIVDGEPVLIIHGDAAHAARRVADHLKAAARTQIPVLVRKHCDASGASHQAIRFKDTASRWGSCSSNGNLNFSWRIMMAPPAVINYLVAHEVAHLTEMNHGPRFWALCETLCPDTVRCRDWLKRNGSRLQAISFG